MLAAGVCVLILGLGAYGVHILSYNTHLVVSGVAVIGATDETNTVVTQFAQTQLATSTSAFISPRSIFAYDPTPLAGAIYTKFPYVASVSIHRTSFLSTT